MPMPAHTRVHYVLTLAQRIQTVKHVVWSMTANTASQACHDTAESSSFKFALPARHDAR